MGNFEKLGSLVIIVLVVTILVLTFWGMNIPIADEPPAATRLSGQLPGGNATPPDVKPDPIPDPWPHDPVPPIVDPVRPDPVTPIPDPIPPAAEIRHTVKKGESLWQLAVLYYSDGNRWKEIAAANPGVTPDNLGEGQTLLIPSPDGALPDNSRPDPEPALAGRTYRVKKGDSLYVIAKRELGTGSLWKEIYRLNENLIGPDSSRVPVGITLVLPR